MPHSTDIPRQGRNQCVLYLDYDGVLHHESVYWKPKVGAYIEAEGNFTLFEHSQLLADVLAPYPDLKIVLSTSWARQYGCSKASKRLIPALRERVIGSTFHTGMDKHLFQQAARGAQVWADVSRRQPKAWIALDDDHFDWPR